MLARAKSARTAVPKLVHLPDSLELVDQVERDASAADDPYWRWVEGLTPATLAAGDVDEAEGARLLRQTMAGRVIATASRQAGFAIGFEYAMRLARGEEVAARGKEVA